MISTRFISFVALLGVFVLFVLSPALVQAQQLPNSSLLASPNVKDYGRSGYPKITVYVWGSADTGVWSVEDGTDLIEFTSVISRVQFAEQRPDSRSTRTLRLYRKGHSDGSPFFESRIEKLFTQSGGYPDLQEGDILVLDTSIKSRFTWRDIREVLGTAAIFLNTYLLIDQLR